MRDDLVKRLRDACRSGDGCKCTLNEAAARIEALEVERDEWKALAEAAIKDDAAKNIYYAEVRAKLAKAMEAMQEAIRLAEQPHYGDRGDALGHCFEGMDVIRTALAELKGETDE